MFDSLSGGEPGLMKKDDKLAEESSIALLIVICVVWVAAVAMSFRRCSVFSDSSVSFLSLPGFLY